MYYVAWFTTQFSLFDIDKNCLYNMWQNVVDYYEIWLSVHRECCMPAQTKTNLVNAYAANLI